MRYSVCVIDNDIPASGSKAQEFGIVDSALLNASNLQLLLNHAPWDDAVIQDLIQRLIATKEPDGLSAKWDVYGFTHPAFYVNAINEGFFRSDVIVFDWDYPGAQNANETNAESALHEILQRTFCLVFIFSKADKKDEIDAVLKKPEFLPYKERLTYLDKASTGLDQAGILLQRADDMYGQNFSFKFAGVLRRRSAQCADQILSDMGRASLNDVKNLLVVGEGGKKDFIDFLAERFRTSVADSKIYDLVEQIPDNAGPGGIDAAMASKVWSYRLYFQQETGDELVRRGDIVRVGTEVLLVLSADCDLMRFWLKNFGIINAVALHELDQSNASLRQLLKICVKPNLDKPVHNLLGKLGDLSEGPFVLPFVPNGDGFKHFVAMPKDLVSRRIATPTDWGTLGKGRKRSHPMKYGLWEGASRLCTISEPFLTPVIQHIFNALGGTGVPDYPEHMKEILKRILADFEVEPAAPAPPVNEVPAPAAVAGVPVQPSAVNALAATAPEPALRQPPEATMPELSNPEPPQGSPTDGQPEGKGAPAPEPKA